ncbi:MAG: low molecular weight protein-tyrosine-phosphatase [Pseudomonadota bacterium]
MKPSKILVICTGNICRSPVGEVLLRARLPEDFEVRSAGVGALVGNPADPASIAWSEQRGASLDQHRGQQLDQDLVHWADLILVMEKRHVEDIASRHPTARGKIMLLSHWTGGEDIPDPYRKSHEDFDFALSRVEEGIQAWSQRLVR